MQVSVETGEGLERRMKIDLPFEQIAGEVDKRLQKLARSARLPGFRPGKVPMKVLRQRYGDQVEREVFGELVQSSFTEAVSSQALRLAGTPQFEPDIDPAAKRFGYTAIFEVLPELELASLGGQVVKRPVAEVDRRRPRGDDRAPAHAAQDLGAGRSVPPRPAIGSPSPSSAPWTGNPSRAAPPPGSDRAGRPGHDPGLRGRIDRGRGGRDPHPRSELPGGLPRGPAGWPAGAVRGHGRAGRGAQAAGARRGVRSRLRRGGRRSRAFPLRCARQHGARVETADRRPHKGAGHGHAARGPHHRGAGGHGLRGDPHAEGADAPEAWAAPGSSCPMPCSMRPLAVAWLSV